MAIIVSLATVAVCPVDVIKGFPIYAHFYIMFCVEITDEGTGEQILSATSSSSGLFN